MIGTPDGSSDDSEHQFDAGTSKSHITGGSNVTCFSGLPPTPQVSLRIIYSTRVKCGTKVTMGACFSKIFNGCPLRLNCATECVVNKVQYVLLGAEEGIFALNMHELHEATLQQASRDH